MIEVASSLVIRRPPEDVFRFVSDTRNEPKWHTDVVDAEPMIEGPTSLGSRFRWTMNFDRVEPGKRVEAIMRVARFETNRVEELHTENVVMGVQPTITFRTEAEGQDTRFTREITLSFPAGAPVTDDMMRPQVEASNQRFVNNLKALLERDR